MYNTHDRLGAYLSSSIERHELLNMDAFSWTGLERSILYEFSSVADTSPATRTPDVHAFSKFSLYDESYFII